MSEHYISTAFSVGGGRSLNLRDGALMQSTGWKDKNGVEIYEGDVVLLDVNNGFDYVDNKAFVVQESRYHSGLVFADPSSEMEYRIFNKDSVGGYSYEVIGNIHETPELLKEDEIRE
ncbi:YopX family protein [Enterococcus faecalis]